MLQSVNEQVKMLQRHLEILETVMQHEPIGIVNLSQETDYPRHQVRYSLRRLEAEHMLVPTDQGAQTTDETTGFVTTLDDRINQLQEQIQAIDIIV